MVDKKEQKIVVLVTFSPADKNLILSGVNLAVAFGKELCIACRLNKKERKNHHLFKQKLIDYTLPLKKELPGLKTPVLLLYTTIRHLPEVLADDHEAIVIIAASNLFRSYSKAVPVSPVPFLFIPSGAPLSSFRNIVIPVDLRKENSDSLLWCSWFGRFNQSEITLIAASEKRKETQRLVARNVLLAKNLFQKFNVAHKLFRGEKGSLQNSYEAIEFARSANTDLIVLLGSSVITPLDWLLGLPERKIIRNEKDIPVLLINPRRDNYIMCD